jgi:hypothetical protein
MSASEQAVLRYKYAVNSSTSKKLCRELETLALSREYFKGKGKTYQVKQLTHEMNITKAKLNRLWSRQMKLHQAIN